MKLNKIKNVNIKIALRTGLAKISHFSKICTNWIPPILKLLNEKSKMSESYFAINNNEMPSKYMLTNRKSNDVLNPFQKPITKLMSITKANNIGPTK